MHRGVEEVARLAFLLDGDGEPSGSQQQHELPLAVAERRETVASRILTGWRVLAAILAGMIVVSSYSSLAPIAITFVSSVRNCWFSSIII